MAKNLEWRGTTSTAWNLAENWYDLGASANSTTVPTSADTCTVNAAPTRGEINLVTTDGSAKSLDLTNLTTLSGSGVTLYVYGSLTIPAGLSVTFTGSIFPCYRTNGTLTTNAVNLSTLSSIRFLGGSGGTTATLSGALNVTGKPVYVLYNAGAVTFDNSGNNQIDCSTFGDNSIAGAITLTLGSSTINCSNVSFAAATLTVSDNTATINVTATDSITSHLGGVAWGTAGDITKLTDFVYVMPSGKILTLSGANTVGHFSLSWAALTSSACRLALTANQTAQGTFTFTGSTTNTGPQIYSSTAGTRRTITVNGAVTVTGTVYFVDIVGAGTASPGWDLSAIASGNLGNNSGITFRTPATYYAKTLTANRNCSANIWSLDEDGSTADGASVFPIVQDMIVINNYTGDNSNKVLSVDFYFVPTIDASACTEALTVAFAADNLWYGDILLNGSGITTTQAAGRNIYLCGYLKSDSSDTLDVNITSSLVGGIIYLGFTWSKTGTIKLLSALTTGGTITHSYGTLDLAGQTLTTAIYSSSNSNTRVLKDTVGGGSIVVTGVTGTPILLTTDTAMTLGVAGASLPTFTLGNSALTLTGNVTADFGAAVAKSLAGLNFKKHAGDYPYILLGVGNNYGAVAPETPDASYQFNKIQWGNSASQKNVTSFNATGHASYPIYIQSDSAGVPAHLTDTNAGTNTFTYCNIKDMHVTGGTWDATGAGNVDVSGNEGWTWPAVAAKILVAGAWKAVAASKIMVGGAWKVIAATKKMVSGAWKA